MKKIAIIIFCFLCFNVFAKQQQTFSLRQTPWLTEEAVHFLSIFLQKNPNAKILEFGSGASTIWLAKQTPNLFSIEHDKKWYDFVNQSLNTINECHPIHYLLVPRPYYTICSQFEKESFDLILVDGRDRTGCIVNSLKLLKPGGILMLDNAERIRYQAVFSLMKTWKTKITEQKSPDSEGFFYRGWQTRWWYKPKNKFCYEK